MSAFLPRIVRNTRRSAEIRRDSALRLADTHAARNVTQVRVRQGFQSFPAYHRYPLTCGRTCVSPSHPPAFFSARSTGALMNCRHLASLCCACGAQGVTRRHFRPKINRITLLPKGAYNASRNYNSIDHGLGGHDGALRVRSCGHHVPVRLFDGGRTAAVNPLPLTPYERLPMQSASRGRFVMSSPNKKDSPCSKRS